MGFIKLTSTGWGILKRLQLVPVRDECGCKHPAMGCYPVSCLHRSKEATKNTNPKTMSSNNPATTIHLNISDSYFIE